MKTRTKTVTAAALAAGLLLAGAAPALAAPDGAPATHPPYADKGITDKTPAELEAKQWYVGRDGEWFLFAKHRWLERHREATPVLEQSWQQQTREYVPGTDAVTHKEYRYEITRPYYTLEHKQIKPNGDARVLNWLEQIGATDAGDGWWAVPDAVIATVPNFNPITVADTGRVNINAYGGPNVTVDYRKTQTISLTPGQFTLEQHDVRLFWNGTAWVTSQDAAIWLTQDQAPTGGIVFNTRTVTDQEAVQGHYTDWADAGDPVTGPQAPGGDDLTQWVAAGEVQVGTEYGPWSEWVEYIPWNKHMPPRPDYEPGYTADTQEFKPEALHWKVRPVTVDPADPADTVDPAVPADPTDPAVPAVELTGPEVTTGGTVIPSDSRVPVYAAALAGGLLIAGGIAVPFTVVHRARAKK